MNKNERPKPKPRRKHKPWTTKDKAKLSELVEEGYGYAYIAKKLQRTEYAVRAQAGVIRARIYSSGHTLSAKAIADMLGFRHVQPVTGWILRRGLKAIIATNEQSPNYRVKWMDLYAWLEDENNWMCYDPERAPDPAFRDYLLEMRVGKPKWIGVGEAAQRLCVAEGTVNGWIHQKQIAAVRYGRWWLREDVVASFVLPSSLPRTHKKPMPRIKDRRAFYLTILRMKEEGYMHKTIAETLGVTRAAISQYLSGRIKGALRCREE